jgi:hypothetical protein
MLEGLKLLEETMRVRGGSGEWSLEERDEASMHALVLNVIFSHIKWIF